MQAPETLALQFTDEAHQLRSRRHRVHPRDWRTQWLRTELLDALLVEEARVQVTDAACVAPLGRAARLVGDVARGDLGVVAQDLERAEARAILGDGRSLDPRLVDVMVEIVLGPNRGAEVVGVDARGE